MSVEMVAFTVDYQIDFSFKNDYHKVVFRSSRLAVDYVVAALDFTCEVVFFVVSDLAHRLLSEDDGRFVRFQLFLSHFFGIYLTKVCKL